MHYGINREEGLFGPGDKKRKKDSKEKKKDSNAPPVDRIPIPPLPDSVLNERRIHSKDVGKKVRVYFMIISLFRLKLVLRILLRSAFILF